MKLLRLLGVLYLLTITIFSYSQKDETILTIGSNKFSANEFWHIYNKNNHIEGINETPKQFADRFIIYKLKVVEAQSQGLDTIPEFISEYSKYREELANSYLVDSAAIELSARDAYKNMIRMVNASHILVGLPQNPTPADTIKAWVKIIELRQKILNGEDFNLLASIYSDDPSSRQNHGRLGSFTAFQMVYPFEKAAFNTPPGEISSITRTIYGYHLIKVHENIPNPGKIKVAHIMRTFTQEPTPEIDATEKAFVDSIYNELLEGADFAQMARLHSHDTNSANNGGEMQPFALNEIVPEFASAAFNLKEDNEISQPIRTPFGWHIIKRIELQPIDEYKTLKPLITTMMGRDERSLAGQKAFINTKRKTQSFKLYQDIWDELVKPISDGELSNETFFSKVNRSNQPLFSYKTTSVSAAEFIIYLEKKQSFEAKEGRVGLEKVLDNMISETILSEEKEILSSTNEHFRYLSNEYHDGLLIFELTNREIWSKADSDTTALHHYYLNNLHEFSEPTVLQGTQCIVTNRKLIKTLTKELKKAPETSLVQILKTKSVYQKDYCCNDGTFPFRFTEQNPVKTIELPESNPAYKTVGSVFWQGTIMTGKVIPYNNCRGMVISNYQNNKEKEWINKLRLEHKSAFNKKILIKTSGEAKK